MIGLFLVAAPTIVLVTGPPPGPDAARIAAARDELRKNFRLIDGPRDVLEGYAVPPSPEEQVRDALERAHQSLRRFQLDAVRQALGQAREAAAHLVPTDDNRRLASLLALREAELAVEARDRSAQRHGAACALSIDPALTPDPQRVPPALMKVIEVVRRTLAKAPRSRLRVESTPPGARIVVGDHLAGNAPVEIEAAQGPLVVWASAEGRIPRALWTEARDGQTITIDLDPVDDAARLRPLVATLRQTEARNRRQAALAVADALGVDGIALLEADRKEPTIYRTKIVEQPVAQSSASPAVEAIREPVAPPPAPAPIFKRAWFWAIVGGVAVASAGVVAVYYYSQPESLSYTCCH